MPTPSDERTTGDVSLTVDVLPTLSYAMAHNRIPVVNGIAITNAGSTIRAAVLRLELNDATGPLGRPQELFIALSLNLDQVRHLRDFVDVAEDLADAGTVVGGGRLGCHRFLCSPY